jgi:hypothetical protein
MENQIQATKITLREANDKCISMIDQVPMRLQEIFQVVVEFKNLKRMFEDFNSELLLLGENDVLRITQILFSQNIAIDLLIRLMHAMGETLSEFNKQQRETNANLP